MPGVNVGGLDWSTTKIYEAMGTYISWPGFTGDTCYACFSTVNVLAGASGWFCTCGWFNCLSWSHHRRPHNTPDLGPPVSRIRIAVLLNCERPFRSICLFTEEGERLQPVRKLSYREDRPVLSPPNPRLPFYIKA